ncbi:hypothetical protein A1D31_22240 [Bradyrhizobium liaoningense]|nr:hypothetical protein A1D31_22240 [Bradyrhizobium liaoningense]
MNLRMMIAQRIQAKGLGPFWKLDCFVDLIERGVSRNEALDALKDFADEISALKKNRRREELT